MTTTTETGPEGFYVTVQRQSGGGRVKTGLLLGPYREDRTAAALVDQGRRLAVDVDPFTAFDAFGVTRIQMRPGATLPLGKLNDRLVP